MKILRCFNENGPRIEGSNTLDLYKVQAPCIVEIPSGGYRLFYTAIGPGKPYPECQGYILSAISYDGLTFQKESGIRLAPQPLSSHMSLRVLAPSIVSYGTNKWRMYFEARGPANIPTVICSAISTDMLKWDIEDGIRLERTGGLGGPRYTSFQDGVGRLYCCNLGPNLGEQNLKQVISAVTHDGLNFEFEQNHILQSDQYFMETGGITAGAVIPPVEHQSDWAMVYSAWQDVPTGTTVPLHPSHNTNSKKNLSNDNFAAESIKVDMAGYRSRIFIALSEDGKKWGRATCIIDGGGHNSDSLDAVHAEDMSVIKVSSNTYRIYYACCDRHGNWRVASARLETD